MFPWRAHAAAQAEEKAAKQAKKDEKKEAARARAEEERRKENAARLQAEEAERLAAEEREAAKKSREALRKALQREKKRLRAAAEAAAGSLEGGADDVERLCNGLDLEAMQRLCGELEAAAGEAEAQAALLAAAVGTLTDEEGRRRAEEERARQAKVAEILAKQQEEQRRRQERMPWTEEDLKALDKALKSFPHGTLRRWEQIAAYMGDRTAEEVLEMSKLKASKARLRSRERGWRPAPCPCFLCFVPCRRCCSAARLGLRAPTARVAESPPLLFVLPHASHLAVRQSAATPVDDFNKFLEARVRKGSVEVKDAVTTRLEARPTRSRRVPRLNEP